ncbi:MAG: hypothetical protein V3W04_08305 [Gammaproteobacteria bacterium]
MKSNIYILGILLLLSAWGSSIAGPACQNGQLISQTFINGSKWELCWEHYNREGIVFKEIFYTTPAGLERKVLHEGSLAQIHVAFDDGSKRVFHLAEHGLGGSNLQDLSSSQCKNGQRLMVGTKHGLCKRVVSRGYVYKDYGEQKQGHLLDLFSQSNTDGYTWIVRWQLHDDGTIEPVIGATGALHTFGSNTDYGQETGNNGAVAVTSAINYFWRLDFDIGGNGANDIVEEFNVSSTNSGSEKSLSVNRLTQETSRSVNLQLKRSWRVRDKSIKNADGHAVSYHLEALHAGYDYQGRSDEDWSLKDIYFTRNDSCERFVNSNPTTGGCSSGLTEYLSGQSIDGADVVVWYGLSYHHFPRDEDQPYMPTRWDGFQLIPRDWTATSPLS